MNKILKKIQNKYDSFSFFLNKNIYDFLFFDIETTGFSPINSHLYLIGCIYFKNDNWIFNQFFAENPSEEEDVLREFFKLTKSFKYIVHFNGDTFDIPYLEKKSNLLSIENTLNKLKSIDILKDIRPFKKILGLENCKLKTVEKYLNINRKDIYNGGELIEQYYNYCKTFNKNLKDNLLLHNEEDLYGLMEILRIYDIITFIKNITKPNYIIDIFNIKLCNNTLLFSLKTLNSSPFSSVIKKEKWSCYIYKGENLINFEISLINDTLFHFFSNYNEYYYLPEKDEAIHKSIGKFLPKEKRKPAKASNCYIKKSGLFLQIFSDTSIDLPIFYKSFNSKDKFIYIEDATINKENLIKFSTNFIKMNL
ncbi:ribonuclease H-like domain-containing protein [Defluviitalea phaphyphila]|uniref:ribonuclease H-like domain-containing protein n=1 Tax=Defluviitalea phaphyphila TaxID=1473580 RepID=UPI00073008DF|nr:ribonuclease H-like domain-containing protein [Defluviitalea phaphyphila]